MAEDQIFLSRLRLENRRIQHIPKIQYSYTLNRVGQLTTNNAAMQDLRISIKEIVESRISKSEFNLILFIRQSLTLMKRGTLNNRMYALGIFTVQFLIIDVPSKATFIRNFLTIVKKDQALK